MKRTTADNLTGMTFGIWHCQCSCGAESLTRSDHLKSGATRSCGCLERELTRARSTTHGATAGRKFAAEYVCWANMIRRCYDKTASRFERYGGRGIAVCDRWLDDYAHFLADMGRKPSPTHSIERIDNDGHYEPGNCRWATRAEQTRNRRTTRMLTHNGHTMCLVDWAKHLGRSASTIRRRLDLGLPTEEVLK